MSIDCLANKLKNDLYVLSLPFEEISIDQVEKMQKHRAKFVSLAGSEHEENLKEFNEKLANILKYKLPFRIFAAHKTPSRQARAILRQAKGCQESVRVIEPICFLHGTTSALLALMPATHFSLKPTGMLLEPKEDETMIAPMCGELQTGIDHCGINQRAISGETVRNVRRCWTQYGKVQSFDPAAYADPESFFKGQLEKLAASAPDLRDWDVIIIAFLRFKQWDPDTFTQLCEKHGDEIKQLLEDSRTKSFAKEHRVLKALEFGEERLKEAKTDEDKKALLKEAGSTSTPLVLESDAFCSLILKDYYLKDYFEDNLSLIIGGILAAKIHCSDSFKEFLTLTVEKAMETRIEKKFVPYAKRWQRMQQVFQLPPQIRFDKQQSDWITNAFPLLLASTKVKPFSINKASEYVIDRPVRLGEEIDMCFARRKHMPEIQSWFESHHLNMTLLPYKMLKPAMRIRQLTHAPSQVSEEMPSHLSASQHRMLGELLQRQAVPYYQAPYPGEEYSDSPIPRPLHGVTHAMGVALFCYMLAEIYAGNGISLTTVPGDLEFGGSLHDSARKGDGPDCAEWEAASAANYSKELKITGARRSPVEIQRIENGMINKDCKESISIEQELIHDGDCLEILRFMNLSKFNKEELWFMKRFGSSPDFEQFIREAELFIDLKEAFEIKCHVEHSEHAYADLILILNYAHQLNRAFPTMSRLLSSAIEAFEPEQKEWLTQPLKELIQARMQQLQKSDSEVGEGKEA